jgi:hypothetical protein
MFNVLDQLDKVRAIEAPGSIYYGFVNDSALRSTGGTGRVVGIGWINDPDNSNNTWKLAALGTDLIGNPAYQDSLGISWAQWQLTMIHELGHVHSRHHAPCGTPAGPDPNFPYSNGAIGSQPIYSSFYKSDTAFGLLGSPRLFGSTAPMSDIMSYCDGGWFSDYNYYYVQRFAERFSGATTIPSAAISAISAKSEQTPFLVISGAITSSGVMFRPAILSAHAIGDSNVSSSGYQLVVKTTGGQEITQSVTPYTNSEDPNTSYFSVSIQTESKIRSAEIRRLGLALPSETSTDGYASLASFPDVTWQRDMDGLTINWDSNVAPYLSVFRVTKDAGRRVLALFAMSGHLRVPASEIDGAGVEIQLSSRLNARKLQIIAP